VAASAVAHAVMFCGAAPCTKGGVFFDASGRAARGGLAGGGQDVPNAFLWSVPRARVIQSTAAARAGTMRVWVRCRNRKKAAERVPVFCVACVCDARANSPSLENPRQFKFCRRSCGWGHSTSTHLPFSHTHLLVLLPPPHCLRPSRRTIAFPQRPHRNSRRYFKAS
jgi:hypothetical protein